MDVLGRRDSASTVVGAARSGIAAAELLVERGARVTLSDTRDRRCRKRERARGSAASRSSSADIGRRRSRDADLIVLSPGVPPEQPAIAAARARGVPVIGEVELASRWLKGRVIAITGTKGKSTTTALTGRMLEQRGFRRDGRRQHRRAAERAGRRSRRPTRCTSSRRAAFSSKQIDTFHPWIAVMLNFSPDHLDRHPSVEAYAAAKARIFENQTAGRLGRHQRRRSGGARAGAARRARGSGCSRGDAALDDGHRDRGRLDRRAGSGSGSERLVPLDAIHLLGPHLVDDVMAAATVGAIAGATPAAMTAAVDAFRGLEHAMELVAERRRRPVRERLEGDQRRIGAAVDRELRRGAGADHRRPVQGRRSAAAARAARGAGQGGRRDRRGAAAGATRRSADVGARFTRPTSLEEAVRHGVRAGAAGGVVLLAPACASFDMFRDYAERGRRFKEEVARMVGLADVRRTRRNAVRVDPP